MKTIIILLVSLSIVTISASIKKKSHTSKPGDSLQQKTDETATGIVVRINFSFDRSYDEPGWISVYGSGSFPVKLGNGILVSISGGTLYAGNRGEPATVFPDKVGKSFNFISDTSKTPVEFTIIGLNPSAKYSFELFSSHKSTDIPGAVHNTGFFVKNYSAAKAGEFLIVDEEYTYDKSLNGFKWWNIGEIENAPSNWKSPYDYEFGQMYERYEVISQATDRPAKLQFGFWQDKGARESLSSHTRVNGPGTISTRNSSPSTWWEKDQTKPVDFSRPGDFLHLGIPLWSDNTKLVTTWSPNNDWVLHDQYLPMRVRATIVAVAQGSEFSGWDCWVGKTLRASLKTHC